MSRANFDKQKVLIYTVTAILCLSLYSNYAIAAGQGDSMRPTMTPCDILVLDKDVEPQEGDVVAFQKYGTVAIHRVFSYSKMGKGWGYLTQGDNNPHLDKTVVYPEDVIGVVEYHIETPDCSQYF